MSLQAYVHTITRTKNVHKYEVRGKKIVIRLEKERERKREKNRVKENPFKITQRSIESVKKD